MAEEHHQTLLSPAAVRRWLGIRRFDRYLAAAAGNEELALRLYAWNARVAATAFINVGHLQVALRNTDDHQLSAWYPAWAIDPQCTLFRTEQGNKRAREGQRRLNERSLGGDVRAAAQGLGDSPSHGQVVAALNVGFWSTPDGDLVRTEVAMVYG